MELLYYQDAYIREFDAKVVSAAPSENGLRVLLDRTAFYPGGGGQPHDTGWLKIGTRTYAVPLVEREDDVPWHHITREHDEVPAVAPGQEVRGLLDWERRHLTMRTHTAMHVLSAVVWRDYGAQVTGGNMDPGAGRMDFEFGSLTKELVKEIEEKCNSEVKAMRPVRTQVLPRTEALKIPDLIRTKVNLIPESISKIRTVEIVGLDLQADGGTHVANTREVGQIRITDYKSKGTINKRVYLGLT